jgi:hypothetical protein
VCLWVGPGAAAVCAILLLALALCFSYQPVLAFLPELVPLPSPASADSIPLLSPLIAPNIRALGPILSQLATSPLRSGVEQWIDMLRGESQPPPVFF